MGKKDRFSHYVVLSVTFVCCAIVLFFGIYANRFPYADDWILTEPLTMHSWHDFFLWAISKHVDHRIPIQKIIQYCLAVLTGYDFRALIYFNIFIAVSFSIILLSIIKRYRGKIYIEDSLIPLLILTPTAGYCMWGFQLQFLSSLFFLCLSLFFFQKSTVYETKTNLVFLFLSFFACSLCGMNGLLLSITACSILFFLSIFLKKIFPATYLNKNILKILLTSLLLNGILFFFTLPTRLPGESIPIKTYFMAALNLLSASINIQPILSNTEIGILVFFLNIISIFYVYKQRKNVSNTDIFFITIILSFFTLIFSIILGRAQTKAGLGAGSIAHYTQLTIFLLIIPWILLSKHSNAILKHSIGFLLLFFTLQTYIANFSWRIHNVDKTYYTDIIISHDIKSNKDIQPVIHKFIDHFMWSNDPALVKYVLDGFTVLREKNYPLYSVVGESPQKMK